MPYFFHYVLKFLFSVSWCHLWIFRCQPYTRVKKYSRFPKCWHVFFHRLLVAWDFSTLGCMNDRWPSSATAEHSEQVGKLLLCKIAHTCHLEMCLLNGWENIHRTKTASSFLSWFEQFESGNWLHMATFWFLIPKRPVKPCRRKQRYCGGSFFLGKGLFWLASVD